MPRKSRFFPPSPNGQLVEVTCRTLDGRAFLRPSKNVNELIVGVLGRAVENSQVEICAVTFLSNHYHFLLSACDQDQLSSFMHHINSNISKEINRLHGRSGPLWSRRYDAILVSVEPEAQWARLKYILANGTKEGLVASPLLWPGVQSAHTLVTGEPLEGYWFHRTKEWAARRRGEQYDRYDYATRYQVSLAQLPCARDMDAEDYQNKVSQLIQNIEREATQARQGRQPLGAEAIRRQDPFERASNLPQKRSPRPNFHGASLEARATFRNASTDFYNQYYLAADSLRKGRVDAAISFPTGSFPSPLPFVGPLKSSRAVTPPTRTIVRELRGKIRRGPIPLLNVGTNKFLNEGSD